MNPEPRPTNSRPVSGMPRLSKKRRRKSSNGRPPGRSRLSSSESSSLRAILSAPPCAEIVTTADGDMLDQRRQARHRDRQAFRDLRGQIHGAGRGLVLRLELRGRRGLRRLGGRRGLRLSGRWGGWRLRGGRRERQRQRRQAGERRRRPRARSRARPRAQGGTLAKTHLRLRHCQHGAAASPRRLRNIRLHRNQLSVRARVPGMDAADAGRHAILRALDAEAQRPPASPRCSLKTREATIIDSRMIGTPI